MEKVGSEIALRQVPARPNFAAGSYLHASLAWHLGTVYRGPGMCVFEARSLIAFHPLRTNHQASCSLFSLAELVSSAQARSLSASNYSNVILVFSEVREHLRLSKVRAVTRAHYGSLGEGAHKTLLMYKLGMPFFFSSW